MTEYERVIMPIGTCDGDRNPANCGLARVDGVALFSTAHPTGPEIAEDADISPDSVETFEWDGPDIPVTDDMIAAGMDAADVEPGYILATDIARIYGAMEIIRRGGIDR